MLGTVCVLGWIKGRDRMTLHRKRKRLTCSLIFKISRNSFHCWFSSLSCCSSCLTLYIKIPRHRWWFQHYYLLMIFKIFSYHYAQESNLWVSCHQADPWFSGMFSDILWWCGRFQPFEYPIMFHYGDHEKCGSPLLESVFVLFIVDFLDLSGCINSPTHSNTVGDNRCWTITPYDTDCKMEEKPRRGLLFSAVVETMKDTIRDDVLHL